MSVADRPFDLVLFDLDGTLIDSAPQLALAVNRTLAELGLAEADESVVRTWVGNGADKLIQRALDYRDAPEQFAKARPCSTVTIRPVCWKAWPCMTEWPGACAVCRGWVTSRPW